MKSESTGWVYFDSLDSGRGQFDEYYQNLSSISDINTPDTEIIQIDDIPRGDIVGQVRDAMEQNRWDRAFLRTMQKAAPRNLQKGSIIFENTASEVESTVESLLVQTSYSEWKTGGAIAVRELVDVKFCTNMNHTMCHPEVRFFIENGEVISMTPDAVQVVCDDSYEYLSDVVEQADPPIEMAESVAEEFSNKPWAVDFVLNTEGEWVCLEMNLNGVRKDEQGRWMNMCGQGDLVHLGPTVVHPLHWF
jgi:hypothetical protein